MKNKKGQVACEIEIQYFPLSQPYLSLLQIWKRHKMSVYVCEGFVAIPLRSEKKTKHMNIMGQDAWET